MCISGCSRLYLQTSRNMTSNLSAPSPHGLASFRSSISYLKCPCLSLLLSSGHPTPETQVHLQPCCLSFYLANGISLFDSHRRPRENCSRSVIFLSFISRSSSFQRTQMGLGRREVALRQEISIILEKPLLLLDPRFVLLRIPVFSLVPF